MEDRSLSPTPDRTPPDHTSNTPVVTIFADSPQDHSNDDDIILPPESKKVRLSSPVPAPLHTKAPPIIDSAGIMAAAAAAAATANSGNSQNLSNHEVQAVRQLISGEFVSFVSYSGSSGQSVKSICVCTFLVSGHAIYMTHLATIGSPPLSLPSLGLPLGIPLPHPIPFPFPFQDHMIPLPAGSGRVFTGALMSCAVLSLCGPFQYLI